MPAVNVKVLEGVFSLAQKQELIRKITDVFVEMHGESMRPGTIVLVEEIQSGCWGIGGKAFATEDVTRMLSTGAQR